MKKTLLLLALAALVAICGDAQATPSSIVASPVYSDCICLADTGWSNSVSLPKFDSSLGTLDHIEFTITGTVSGWSGYENLKVDGVNTITTNLQASLTLQRPNASLLVVALPAVTNTAPNVPQYDGVTDWAGTSGGTYGSSTSPVTASKTESNTSYSPSDFTLFTGTGNITLPVVAVGISTATDTEGNVASTFVTQAGACASVQYFYEVPEPMTMSLLALGGLAVVRRKRA